MLASTFRRIVTMDVVDLLERFLRFLEINEIPYCAIGGQAVNAYVEPLVSLDLDLVVAMESVEQFSQLSRGLFSVAVFPHSLNISLPGSDLRIQLQTDQRYLAFIARAEKKEVLGRTMYVASLEDVLQGKVWAVMDSERRGSKRQKDLADISRILEADPALRVRVPEAVLTRLI